MRVSSRLALISIALTVAELCWCRPGARRKRCLQAWLQCCCPTVSSVSFRLLFNVGSASDRKGKKVLRR